MPEIKHNFTGGKMNKDVDERLVPKGEYRHAMNIQVSTSEESNVGTVQNILGNIEGCTETYGILDTGNSFTVGSIADEKNDTLYWLVSGQPFNDLNADTSVDDWTQFSSMYDAIIRKTPELCEPVFVDKFAFTTPNDVCASITFLSQLPTDIMEQVQVGWSVAGVNDNGTLSNTVLVAGIDQGPTYSGDPSPMYIGNRFGIEMGPGFGLPGDPPTWFPMGNNILYVFDYNPNINPISLVGNNVTLFEQGNTNAQTHEIQSATITSLAFAGGIGMDVLKLVLTTNLTTFIPSATTNFIVTPLANGLGVSSQYLNNIIYGSIEDSTTGVIAPVPAGIIVIDPLVLDVNSLSIGDPVSLPNATGCISQIFTAGGSNAIQVADCITNVPISNIPSTTFDFSLPSQGNITLDQPLNLSSCDYSSLLFIKPRVLNFNHNEFITGINIVDDMLFWTDGKTEPKKINIPRSIEGTFPDGQHHTRLINHDLDINYSSNVLVEEKHITVIRKAPLNPPMLDMSLEKREGVTSGSNVVFYNELNGSNQAMFAGKSVGDLVWITVDAVGSGHPNFQVDDVIRLASDVNDLPDEWDLRVGVLEKHQGPFVTSSNNQVNITTGSTIAYLVTIYSISPDANINTGEFWRGFLEDDGDYLFERKFPRFAYRYKYSDNEYSTFSPFSEVAFLPGPFNYEPIKAYNTGMINKLKKLTLKNFITPDIPKDVIRVDILYKNEMSPNIYLLDTLSKKDEPTPNNWEATGSVNVFNSSTGSYEVLTENIHATLPSNQLLRSWDGVPRSALAQEITSSRLVYGNYKQGYNLKETLGSDKNMRPDITLSLKDRKIIQDVNVGEKSIKSLRNYDVGVVWGDKYGRETPVITPSAGSILIPKTKADRANMFNVELKSSPHWADYYRFYIKETSNEYYNLAVDRVYDAEDGNVWISFPSVDRNKVDEDTYIILKKGVNSDDLIKEEAKYKIVAIENEAPDFIKTSFTRLVRTNTDDSRPTHSCNMWGGSNSGTGCTLNGGVNAPTVGAKGFTLNSDLWGRPILYNNDGTVLMDASYYDIATSKMGLSSPEDLFNEVTDNTTQDEFYVSFSRETSDSGVTTVITGTKYKVTKVFHDHNTPHFYKIELATPILSTDEFVTEGQYLMNDNIHVHFWKKTLENKPEFDGRFFVKILNDQIAIDNLSTVNPLINNWAITAAPPVYKFIDQNLDYTGDDIYNYNSNNSTGGTQFRTKNQWEYRLKFGGSFITSGWFIDGASFASFKSGNPTGNAPIGISGSDYMNPAPVVDFNANNGNTYKSSDNISFVDMTYTGYPLGAQTSMSYDGTLGVNCLANPGSGCSTPNQNFGTGDSLGLVGMKAAFTTATGNYFDLSYSRIVADSSSVAFDVGLTSNTGADEERAIVSSLQHGRRFRFKGSDVIYKIQSVQKFRLHNYKGGSWIQPSFLEVTTMLGTVGWESNELAEQWEDLRHQNNRRFTYRIKYTVDELASPTGTPLTQLVTDDVDSSGANIYNSMNVTSSNPIEFLTEFTVEGENPISSNPAIFETEPKEDIDIDLYYEASSSFPTFPITNANKELFIPIGSTITMPYNSAAANLPIGLFVTSWQNIDIVSPEYKVNLSTPIPMSSWGSIDNNTVVFTKDNGDSIEATVIQAGVETIDFDSDGDGVPDTPTTMITSLSLDIKKNVGLNWFNCWSFNNGVESNRIGDTYNKPFIKNGVIASSVIEEDYKEETRQYGLIYSGIYNSNSSTNELNQFITAEKITKDINPIYGSIQKLFQRRIGLVAFCEDRVIDIMAGKDTLFNADGNSQLIASNRVLGTATPFVGEYGISKNPESFASESYRVYFTDKVRGSVIRLSKDGLTPISDHGMKDWFRDNLQKTHSLVGSYDDYKQEYNLTLRGEVNNTVSFKEDVRGWVSFKSFIPENAVSCANQYYTFLNGKLWRHHENSVDRNTFYGIGEQYHTDSLVDVIFNDVPGSIKSFKTLNYEGSQAKVTKPLDENNVIVEDGEYFNLVDEKGWYVNNVTTDLENGSITEFVDKEGKWFGHIIGNEISKNPQTGVVTGNFDTSDFSIQGIGKLSSISTDIVWGCTCDGGAGLGNAPANDCYNDGIAAFNYNSAVTNDDGSCIAVNMGCMDPSADNYDQFANTDDNSCIWYGCTDPIGQLNYDPQATVDDGSCIPAIAGCQVPGMFNYDVMGSSNVACGGPYLAPGDGPNGNNLPTPQPADYCCIPFIYGCSDPNADNFIALTGDDMVDVNADDGSCEYLGCTDPIAINFSFPGSAVNGPFGYFTYLNGVAVDDGSCVIPGGCMDDTACNYDATAVVDDGSCNYCGDVTALNYDGADVSCIGDCIYCSPPTNGMIVSQTTVDQGMANGEVVISFDEPTSPASTNYYYPNSYIINYAGFTTTISQLNPGNSTGWGTGTITWSWNGWTPGPINISIESQCNSQTGSFMPSTEIVISGTMLVTPILGCTDNTGDYTALGATGMPLTTSPNGTAIGMGTPYMWGACNFDPIATQDDGSCEYSTCVGCTDSGYIEFDATFTQPNPFDAANLGWCTSPIFGGCTDAGAYNYCSACNADCNNDIGGSDTSCCTPFVYGCTDNTTNNNGTYATNFDPNANSPCNASSSGTSAFDAGAGAGNNECCNDYNCPSWNINLINNYLYVTGSFANTTFDVSNPVANSPSGANFVGGNGYFVNETFVGIGGYEIQDSLNITNFFNPGDTTADITLTIGTGPDCMFGPTTYTYTVGCNDPNADNGGSYQIEDNSQCEYTGCMDETLTTDGLGSAAVNYDPTANTPCTTGCVGSPFGASGDNCCCLYTNYPNPSVEWGITTLLDTNGDQQDVLSLKLIHAGTAYNEVHIGDLELGGTNLVVAGTAAQDNLQLEPGASTGAYEVTQFGNSDFTAPNETAGIYDWDDYTHTSGGQEYLTVHALLDVNGTVNNASLPGGNSALPDMSPTGGATFSVGCKYGNSSHINWDATLDLHKPNSCITLVDGCTDPTAIDYNSAFNADCAGIVGGNDYSCCCYGCNKPQWNNPFLDNVSVNATSTPAVAESVRLHFQPVNTAIAYRIFFRESAGTLGTAWEQHNITSAAALSIINSNQYYTFVPGITTQTPNGGFEKNTEYDFYIEANCDGCAAWSDPSITRSYYFDF